MQAVTSSSSRPVLVLGGLFVVSMCTVALGYFDTRFGMSLFPIEQTVRSVPVLRLAALLTLLCPAILAASFWVSKGNVSSFENMVLGWSFMIPFLFVLMILPADTACMEVKLVNFELVYGLAVASQMVAARLLRDWFWANGSRT